MNAREQHIGAATERLGGAVAVMDVPIEDEHPPDAQLANGELRRERDVVEQAEAHRAIGLGVVPGGSHAAEPEHSLAGQQRPCHLTGAAGGVQCGAVGGLADVGVGIDRTSPRQRELPDPMNMPGAVNELQPSVRYGWRLASLPAQPVASGQRLLDREQTLRRIRVLGHVHPRIVLDARRMTEVQPRVLGVWHALPLVHR